MTSILQELAAGRIDAAEAARRIDALNGPGAEPVGSRTDAPEPKSDLSDTVSTDGATTTGSAADAGDDGGAADAWAEATDRPQRATYTRESFVTAERPSGPDRPTSTPHSPRTGADSPADAPRGSARSRSREAAGAKPAQESGKPVTTAGVERISVRAVGRRVRILGEPSIATVHADGPHVLRRNGSVLEISSDGEMGSSLDGFSILKATRSLDDIRSLGLGKELFLRVNPNIVVDVEVTAGSLNTERVPHLGKVRVTAGGAKLLDISQIEDALIQAGQATIKGTIRTGRSRVRAESGSLSIQLGDDSNVTVKGESQLGKISWSGGHTGAGDEVVMGQGSARLDVEVVMGHAQVRIGTDHRHDETHSNEAGGA